MLKSKETNSNYDLIQVRQENMKNWTEDDLLFYEDFFDKLSEKKELNSTGDDIILEESWKSFKTFLKQSEMKKKLNLPSG